MADNDSPFRAIYEFSPRYPVKLSDRLDGMYHRWNGISELGALQVKATFQQFVHELLWQIRLQEVEPAPPDLAAQTALCLRERYREPIALKTIASMPDCSEGHLSRLFKSRYVHSPIQIFKQASHRTGSSLSAPKPNDASRNRRTGWFPRCPFL